MSIALSLLLTPMLLLTLDKTKVDKPGSQDHHLFTRMPGFIIERYRSADFDTHAFPINNGDREGKQTIEGKKTFIDYQLAQGVNPPSPIEVVRNHLQAIKQVGGEQLWQSKDGSKATLRLRQNEKETWVYLHAYGGCTSYHLTVIEPCPMQQKIHATAPSPGSLQQQLSPAAGPAELAVVTHPSNPAQLAVAPRSLQLPGGVRLELVPIPAGSFTMGSPAAEHYRDADEGPQHQVNISTAFSMGKYEVTRAQWHAVMSPNAQTPLREQPDYPAALASYNSIAVGTSEAPGFLSRLNTLTAGQRPAGLAFRLPTEAEWEYAARAGTTTRYYWNDNPSNQHIGSRAWYAGNAEQKTWPVGQKLPNPWGLYDMAGNVYEWCHDRYGSYQATAQVDPTGAKPPILLVGPYAQSSEYVVRGGAWSRPHQECRSASRFRLRPEWERKDLGFRVVLAAPVRQPL